MGTKLSHAIAGHVQGPQQYVYVHVCVYVHIHKYEYTKLSHAIEGDVQGPQQGAPLETRQGRQLVVGKVECLHDMYMYTCKVECLHASAALAAADEPHEAHHICVYADTMCRQD